MSNYNRTSSTQEHSMEDEPLLPTSFWGPVASTPAPAVEAVPTFQQIQAERLSWEQSFSALNLNIDEVMAALYGKHSDAVGHEVRTFEDAYKHVTAPPAPAKKEKLSHVDKAELELARVEWRTAVAERKKAMSSWDDYVKAKHDRFTNLRARL